jgi:hypothetical protein
MIVDDLYDDIIDDNKNDASGQTQIALDEVRGVQPSEKLIL